MSIGCFFYRIFIDPALRPLRKAVKTILPAHSSVLEIASGTGNLAFILADKIGTYTGVDLNSNMVKCSEQKARQKGYTHLNFKNMDGRNLSFVKNKDFSHAVISLAIHEMQKENRIPVLNEMIRCAEKLVLIDFNCPMPGNFSGRLLHSIEFMAGKEHYAGFKSYQANGGLDPLIKELNLQIMDEIHVFQQGIRIILVQPT